MSIDWEDLRLFLDVARLGGLSAATSTTKLSAATMGRRVNALEKQIGEPLFHRAHSGYTLTRAGEELLRRADMGLDRPTLKDIKARAKAATAAAAREACL